MKIAVVAAATAVALVASGCDAVDSKPGNPAVYDRIAAETDCDELQAEFDTAMDNHDRVAAGSEQASWSLGYAKAADARMNELGCYG
jgi:hypothetical protein